MGGGHMGEAAPSAGQVSHIETAQGRRIDLVRRGLVLGGLSALGACAALKPTPETKLIVKIVADASINPSPTGVPSPIQLRVYTLRADTNFVQSDSQALYGNDAAVLGTDMLSKREFVLAPSGEEGFTAVVPAEATVFAVVAGYREMDLAQWRVTAPIAFNQTNTITVSVQEFGVTMSILTLAKHWPF